MKPTEYKNTVDESPNAFEAELLEELEAQGAEIVFPGEQQALGYMVVGVTDSHNGYLLVGSAGGITTTFDAADNHRAYCELRAEAEGWPVGRYAVVRLIEVGGEHIENTDDRPFRKGDIVRLIGRDGFHFTVTTDQDDKGGVKIDGGDVWENAHKYELVVPALHEASEEDH